MMTAEKKKMTPLSSSSVKKGYTPSKNDVICAKGNDARNHPGNIRFRQMVDKLSKDYGNAANRAQKTALVNQIVDFVRRAKGNFIKCESGQWYEISDTMAREKVGQSLRERNHGLYRSSTKAKRKMRREMNQRIVDKVKTVVTTNNAVAEGLHQLSTSLEKHRQQSPESDDESLSDEESDKELEIAMTSANSHILASLKNDESIQTMLNESESRKC